MADPANLNARLEELTAAIRGQRKLIGRLAVAMVLLVLMVALLVSVEFGSLVNWFGGQAALWGGATTGAAFLGFALGFFAGRRIR